MAGIGGHGSVEGRPRHVHIEAYGRLGMTELCGRWDVSEALRKNKRWTTDERERQGFSRIALWRSFFKTVLTANESTRSADRPFARSGEICGVLLTFFFVAWFSVWGWQFTKLFFFFFFSAFIRIGPFWFSIQLIFWDLIRSGNGNCQISILFAMSLMFCWNSIDAICLRLLFR